MPSFIEILDITGIGIAVITLIVMLQRGKKKNIPNNEEDLK